MTRDNIIILAISVNWAWTLLIPHIEGQCRQEKERFNCSFYYFKRKQYRATCNMSSFKVLPIHRRIPSQSIQRSWMFVVFFSIDCTLLQMCTILFVQFWVNRRWQWRTLISSISFYFRLYSHFYGIDIKSFHNGRIEVKTKRKKMYKFVAAVQQPHSFRLHTLYSEAYSDMQYIFNTGTDALIVWLKGSELHSIDWSNVVVALLVLVLHIFLCVSEYR